MLCFSTQRSAHRWTLPTLRVSACCAGASSHGTLYLRRPATVPRPDRPSGNPYHHAEILDELKSIARAEGLWNLFLPDDEYGAGLSNLEYASLAEFIGRVNWASEVFNCAPPDTGNIEILAQFGTPEQKCQWLQPLLDGEIRSAFAMTEPDVASSDATNIQLIIKHAGDEYILNGRKWWISGAMRERCKFFIVMGKTAPDAPERHRQQSMVLVPKDTPGVTIVRDLR